MLFVIESASKSTSWTTSQATTWRSCAGSASILRRIGVGALLVGGLFALGSCEELTRRDAASPAPAAASQTPLLNPAVAGRSAFKQRS